MRTNLIKKYLADQEVYEVIGHHLLVYVKIILGYSLILIAIALLHQVVVTTLSQHPLVTRISAGFGLVIYAVGLYKFIDEYLDALVITDMGLILFRWNGLFSYKTTIMQRVSLETVTDEQNSLADTLFKKGDISIRLEEEEHLFRNVHQPSQQVSKILTWKERILGTRTSYENNPTDQARDKYELLVEALGEVVSEYVEKKDKSHY